MIHRYERKSDTHSYTHTHTHTEWWWDFSITLWYCDGAYHSVSVFMSIISMWYSDLCVLPPMPLVLAYRSKTGYTTNVTRWEREHSVHSVTLSIHIVEIHASSKRERNDGVESSSTRKSEQPNKKKHSQCEMLRFSLADIRKTFDKTPSVIIVGSSVRCQYRTARRCTQFLLTSSKLLARCRYIEHGKKSSFQFISSLCMPLQTLLIFRLFQYIFAAAAAAAISRFPPQRNTTTTNNNNNGNDDEKYNISVWNENE